MSRGRKRKNSPQLGHRTQPPRAVKRRVTSSADGQADGRIGGISAGSVETPVMDTTSEDASPININPADTLPTHIPRATRHQLVRPPYKNTGGTLKRVSGQEAATFTVDTTEFDIEGSRAKRDSAPIETTEGRNYIPKPLTAQPKKKFKSINSFSKYMELKPWCKKKCDQALAKFDEKSQEDPNRIWTQGERVYQFKYGDQGIYTLPPTCTTPFLVARNAPAEPVPRLSPWTTGAASDTRRQLRPVDTYLTQDSGKGVW